MSNDLVAVEVVRRSRFSWDVVSRYSNGFDMSLEMPYMFRCSAMHHAQRKARSESLAPEVVARFVPGGER